MRRALPFLVLMVALLPLAPVRADAPSAHPAPSVLRLRWLEPGALLVQWRQNSAADKATVMYCRPETPDVCKPYAEIFDTIPGRRAVVIPSQPGDLIRLTEWAYVPDVDAFTQWVWTEGVPAPDYPALLPVLRTEP